MELQAERQRRKIEGLKEEVKKIKPVHVFGDEDPMITLVGWGSTKGPALEALKVLGDDGVRARFVQPVIMEPFPVKAMASVLGAGGEYLLLEGNRTAQLGKLIKLYNGFSFRHVYLRYDGRPFNPEEIRDKAQEVLK